MPEIEKKIITVEHYANDDKMLRVIEGKDDSQHIQNNHREWMD